MGNVGAGVGATVGKLLGPSQAMKGGLGSALVRLDSGGDILRIPTGTFHRSISDPDGSVVLNQAVREPGVSLEREFRVYNSARIPALMRATLTSSPKPLLHGVEPVLQAA